MRRGVVVAREELTLFAGNFFLQKTLSLENYLCIRVP